MTTKATLYLDPSVFRALKVRAAQTDKTVSETANSLISHGLTEGKESRGKGSTVQIKHEGKMGFPVLTLKNWPAGFVFDREELYD